MVAGKRQSLASYRSLGWTCNESHGASTRKKPFFNAIGQSFPAYLPPLSYLRSLLNILVLLKGQLFVGGSLSSSLTALVTTATEGTCPLFLAVVA